MDIDQPLSVLVDRQKKDRRSGGRKGASRGGARARGSTREKYASAVPAQKGRTASSSTTKASYPTATKVIVSNLPSDVNQQMIFDLFKTTVGPIVRASLACNDKGVSTGVATIEFKRAEHATQAFQSYNGRLIDQKRPMKVEIVVDPAKVTLADRVAPLSKESISTRGGKSARGRGRGGRGGGSKKGPPKTAADLDAEMDNFMTTSTV